MKSIFQILRTSLILFCFPLFTIYSQNYKIENILDANLFKLNNGKIVRLAYVKTPSINDSTEFSADLARKIKSRSKKRYLNKYFKIEFLNNSRDSICDVIMTKEYIMNDLILNSQFIELGFGCLVSTPSDSSYAKELHLLELNAKEDKRGIWENITEYEDGFLSKNEIELKSSEKSINISLKNDPLKPNSEHINVYSLNYIVYTLKDKHYKTSSNYSIRLNTFHKFDSYNRPNTQAGVLAFYFARYWIFFNRLNSLLTQNISVGLEFGIGIAVYPYFEGIGGTISNELNLKLGYSVTIDIIEVGIKYNFQIFSTLFLNDIIPRQNYFMLDLGFHF